MNPYNFEAFSFQPGLESTLFTTDFGIQYFVYFQDISAFGLRIHSFAFEPIGPEMDSKFKRDPRVADTIATILDIALCQGKEMIAYHPLNNDSRRLRKFHDWFSRYEPTMKCGRLGMHEITFQFDTRTEISFCLLFKAIHKEIADKLFEMNDAQLSEIWFNKT